MVEIVLRDPLIALAYTHLTEPAIRIGQSGLVWAGSGGLSLVHLSGNTPVGSVWPPSQGTDEEQNKENNQNVTEHVGVPDSLITR